MGVSRQMVIWGPWGEKEERRLQAAAQAGAALRHLFEQEIAEVRIEMIAPDGRRDLFVIHLRDKEGSPAAAEDREGRWPRRTT